jgi:hypothetical protein
MRTLALSLPKFTLLGILFKKPALLLITVAPTIVVAPVIDFKKTAWILLYLFLGDLFTGVYASYLDWKKKENKTDKWFFGKGEGFSSDKFKKMGVKGVIYLAFPYFMLKFQETFMIKNLKYETISDAEFTLPTAIILVFCINEGFSIFHENLPRCGFNLFERIKKIAKVFYSTKKSITDEN